MLQVFHVDVTKVDLDVAYIFYRIAGILSEVASLMIDLNVPCNIKLMLQRVFFTHRQRMANNKF